MFEKLCDNFDWKPKPVLEARLELAVEIAREGREGRRIGTIFRLGDAAAVLQRSRRLCCKPGIELIWYGVS